MAYGPGYLGDRLLGRFLIEASMPSDHCIGGAYHLTG